MGFGFLVLMLFVTVGNLALGFFLGRRLFPHGAAPAAEPPEKTAAG